MAQLFANNISTTLDGAITDVATSLVLADATGHPSPTGGDFYLLTLTQDGVETSWEIVKVTARAGTTCTVERAQEGTAGVAWASGSRVQLRMTKGTADNFVQDDDSRLTDARTPTVHATSHKSGGGDAIKLDDLAAPDDNTDLNVSTTAHGLVPKLSGSATQYLSGDGNWYELPLSANWYLTNTASDIGGYKALSTTLPTDAKATVSASITGANVLIEEWAATADDTPDFLSAQVMHVHIHASATTVGKKAAIIYAKFFHRDSIGTETLIGTSENSGVLINSEVDKDLSIPIADVSFGATDRGVLKVYSTASGLGTDPDVTLYYLGVTFARVEAASAATAAPAAGEGTGGLLYLHANFH